MIAAELINDAIPPLRTTDPIQKALDRMAEFKVRHLPLVNEDQYLGLVAEEELTEPDHTILLSEIHLDLLNPYIMEEQHLYEVVRLMYERQISALPVLTTAKTYVGVIPKNALVDSFAEFAAVTEPGGIIVLEVTNINNSLAYMAQIVESDNAKILSANLQSFPDSTRMEMTLKINKPDLSAISASFVRYGYDVKAVFGQTDGDDDTMDRYDSLMNYLNI
ncbi:CBS domain-containing protein [Mucilaginibacter ginkgonis]|uniref:CBS domain-containing protein n=1 Tax=Mucilaginibacter ginkgonis TaxID=2682091 RepID=A0A6I4I1A3_9SPHI|nr:CBS domain-containing protein [Mucilaginibacter ginkgonis]QQL48482.1 CBS domain-containing protein [Mucilaginibacter ginkgonis]